MKRIHRIFLILLLVFMANTIWAAPGRLEADRGDRRLEGNHFSGAEFGANRFLVPADGYLLSIERSGTLYHVFVR